MSRTARTALAATAVFAVSGALSGLLIDEYGGPAGALEWVLRTLVVASGAVAVGAGFVLVLIITRFQQQSASDMRGRMMSVLVFASLTCAALSNALAGLVAQRDAGMLFAGAGGLLLCIMVGFGVSRSVRMID